MTACFDMDVSMPHSQNYVLGMRNGGNSGAISPWTQTPIGRKRGVFCRSAAKSAGIKGLERGTLRGRELVVDPDREAAPTSSARRMTSRGFRLRLGRAQADVRSRVHSCSPVHVSIEPHHTGLASLRRSPIAEAGRFV
jgi:hypothetical protein